MPDPEKSDSEPPSTVISDSVKSVDISERVKVIEAVSPAFNEEVSASMVILGVAVAAASAKLVIPSDA